MRPRPTLQPELLPEPPCSDKITDYDYRLLIVYLRLLDAEADGADWADVARIVLHLDPADKPREARAVHAAHRSEEHTSELQSLMRISYAVFRLKKKRNHTISLTKTQ